MTCTPAIDGTRTLKIKASSGQRRREFAGARVAAFRDFCRNILQDTSTLLHTVSCLIPITVHAITPAYAVARIQELLQFGDNRRGARAG
jgi:hypothetical protein